MTKSVLARSNAMRGRLPLALIALGSDGGLVSRGWLATDLSARGLGRKVGSSDRSRTPELPDCPLWLDRAAKAFIFIMAIAAAIKVVTQ